MASSAEVSPPPHFAIGQDLNWNAPWIDVNLWVELPFWLMVDNTTVNVEVEAHEFPIALHDNYFELHCNLATDSKISVCYRGPLKKREELTESIRETMQNNPDVPFMWRKCKTILKIATRCNQDIWSSTATSDKKLRDSTVKFYLEALSKAHIPVVNRCVQGYRLATYDYFAFEISPWDVPRWWIERGGNATSAILVPYRAWDVKPEIYEGFQPSAGPTGTPKPYQLISGADLSNQISMTATPGEFELLDALNLMERGDYSGAVRRITTAIEVVVEHVVARS